MKEILDIPFDSKTFIRTTRPQPATMLRLRLACDWPEHVKVGTGIEIDWFDGDEKGYGLYYSVEGDVCYRRSDIIHVNGVCREWA